VQAASGTPAVLVIMGAVSLIGGLTSFFWAPETNGQPLTVTSHRSGQHRFGRRTVNVPA